MSEEHVLPELDVTAEDERSGQLESMGTRYFYSKLARRFAELTCRERQLRTILASLAQSEAERERLQGQLTTVLARESAATARHDAKLEQLETKLVRERERNQGLRQVVTNATYRMIALHGEGDYEECGEALWDCDCDLAKEYKAARALLAPHTEPQPAPVVTGEGIDERTV